MRSALLAVGNLAADRAVAGESAMTARLDRLGDEAVGQPVFMPTMTPRRLPAGLASTSSQVWRYLRVGSRFPRPNTASRLAAPEHRPVLGQAAVSVPPESSSTSARNRCSAKEVPSTRGAGNFKEAAAGSDAGVNL